MSSSSSESLDNSLDDFHRLVAKYTIRYAIEKLLLLNLGRKKQLIDNLPRMKKYELASEADVENNIDYVKSTLIEICKEIEYDGSFDKLQKFSMGERSQDPIGQSFLRMYAINKSMAEYLEKKVPEEENLFKESEKEMMMDENTLDERSLNNTTQREMEIRYNQNWEEAKLDQFKYQLEQEESQNYLQYDRYKSLLIREEEAAKHLIDCYQAKIAFLEDNLEYWTGEYERQMENVTTDIHLTQDWISELEKKIAGQEQTYKNYEDDVEKFFLKRRKIRCARRIQSWWRGVLAEKATKRKATPRNRKKSPRKKAPPIPGNPEKIGNEDHAPLVVEEQSSRRKKRPGLKTRSTKKKIAKN